MDLRFRRLFLLRFSLVLWSFFLLYVTGFLAFEVLRHDEALEARRRLDLEQQIRLAHDLVARGREADLVESFRHSLRLGRLDFFAWKKDGKLLSAEGRVPTAGLAPDGQVAQAGTLLFARIEAGPDALAFGVDIGWRARAAIIWKHERLPWAKDYALLGLSLGLILYVFFRDLARASADTRRPDRARAEPKALREKIAAEGAPAPAGLFGAVAFALPPANAGRGEALKEKYELAARLLHRYGAEILSAEGEIFLVAFPADSAAAFAAARDLAREGAALSLAAGESELVPLGHARVPVGAVWAEVREALLPTPAYRRVRVAPNGPALTLPLFHDQGGWQEASVDVHGALSLARAGDADYLRYFRRDEDLATVLDHFAEGPWDTKAILASLSALRAFACPDGTDPKIVAAYARFLSAELKLGEAYRIGAALALSTHLLAPAAVTAELEALFLEALARPEPRTKANAIEVFIHFFPDREIPALKPYLRDGDNRLAAIALIKAALEHLDERVVRLLDSRIREGSVAHAASALYALGEIAGHYRRLDAPYLASKEAFLALFAQVPKLSQHPNPMVRRQAVIAARKLGSPKIDERLRLVFEECEEESLKELFATIYGWRKEERRAA